MAIITGADVTLEGPGTPLSLANPESMSVVSNTGNQVWEIDDDSRHVLDFNHGSFTVEVTEDGGSSWQTLSPSEYDLRYLLGRVDIDDYTSNSGTLSNIDDVRISGQYIPRAAIGRSRSVDHSPNREATEDNYLGANAKNREYLQLDYSASIERSEFDVQLNTPNGTEKSLEEHLRNEEFMVLTIDMGSGQVERALAVVSDSSVSAAPGELLSDTLDFEGSQRDASHADQNVRVWDFKPHA